MTIVLLSQDKLTEYSAASKARGNFINCARIQHENPRDYVNYMTLLRALFDRLQEIFPELACGKEIFPEAHSKGHQFECRQVTFEAFDNLCLLVDNVAMRSRLGSAQTPAIISKTQTAVAAFALCLKIDRATIEKITSLS